MQKKVWEVKGQGTNEWSSILGHTHFNLMHFDTMMMDGWTMLMG